MGTGKEVRNLKTRCYYTDYVKHMIRFYLSTPTTLKMDNKRHADIENWLAVQDVFRKLSEDDRITVAMIYDLHYRVPEGVRMYCEKTGADQYKTWVLITKTCAAVAKKRGLV